MMKIEDQVCSLELAKKLRELGVTQNSLWYWVRDGEDYVVISDGLLTLAGGTPANENVFSAFTVAELGEILRGLGGNLPWHFEGRWGWGGKGFPAVYTAATEANARAAHLGHLIKFCGAVNAYINR